MYFGLISNLFFFLLFRLFVFFFSEKSLHQMRRAMRTKKKNGRLMSVMIVHDRVTWVEQKNLNFFLQIDLTILDPQLIWFSKRSRFRQVNSQIGLIPKIAKKLLSQAWEHKKAISVIQPLQNQKKIHDEWESNCENNNEKYPCAKDHFFAKG